MPHLIGAQSSLILCNPMACSPPGSSVQGILRERILEWVVIFSTVDILDPEIKHNCPALAGDSLRLSNLEVVDIIGYEIPVCRLLPGTPVMSAAITRHLHKLSSSPPFWTEPSCCISIFSSYEIVSRRVKKILIHSESM